MWFFFLFSFLFSFLYYIRHTKFRFSIIKTEEYIPSWRISWSFLHKIPLKNILIVYIYFWSVVLLVDKKIKIVLIWRANLTVLEGLAAVELLRARDGGQQIIDSVDVTCGLSLGEYTALAFAGAFRWVTKSNYHLLQWLFYCFPFHFFIFFSYFFQRIKKSSQ